MLALSLLLLSAAPAPLRVAVPNFNVINIDKESADFFMDRFATRLRGKGLLVTTATEMETVLGLERQKSLLGCADANSTCQAEIAAALGADGIVRARVARFGKRFELSLTLINPADAAVISSLSKSAEDEGKVLDALDAAADELSEKFFAAKKAKAAPIAVVVAPPKPELKPEPKPVVASAEPKPVVTTPEPIPAVSSAPSTGRPVWVPIVPLAIGVAAGVSGSVMLGNSYAKVPRISSDNGFETIASQARVERALGITFLVVGGAGLATAAILFFTGREPVATPVAAISPSGGWVGVEGRLP